MDFHNKTILVTGGTGSFGQKCVQRLLTQHHPRRIIIFSRDELKQMHMQERFQHPSLRFFIGDVRDKDRLYRAFRDVDFVIHAAALKQVPAIEYNPFEAIQTNIIGAHNIINAAIDCGVEKVIALSTDKAANPINLYGATKLCSDKLFVSSNSMSGDRGTRFAVVRYGNVAGSRGSVIPLFMRQKESGQLTITDERMTRFIITLDRGVDLVLKAFDVMSGGEIFVPKIPSARITDIAQAIAPECKQVITGIRPGEKLHEIMITPDDSRNSIEFDSYYVIQPQYNWWDADGYLHNNGSEAKPCPDGFSYASDTNTQWLSIEQIRELSLTSTVEQARQNIFNSPTNAAKKKDPIYESHSSAIQPTTC